MGKRILVADDSLTIQQAFAMVMDGSGYSLSFAKSVEEAVAAAKGDGRPDLVVSDAVLGSGSGYDLCARIKAQPALRNVPVFILASNQSPYDEVRGREVGADGHLAKPFESQALLDAVASALLPPSRPISLGVLPELPADMSDNTTRSELPVDYDDSYGEIVIERAPAPPPAPAWTAKPAARPSGSMPVVGAGQAPAAQPSPRPSLIPGARPSASMPVARPATTPQPATAPPPVVPRPTISRTMMGFPSVKQAPPPSRAVTQTPPPPPSKAVTLTPPPPARTVPRTPPPPARTVPPTPPPPAAVQPPPLVRRFTPPTPTMAVPPHPVAAPSPPLPTALRPPLPPPVWPMPPAAPRPVVPRLSPPPPTAAAPVVAPTPAEPITRKVRTPAPPTVVPGVPPIAAAVASVVDQKVSSLAARGPEYEAIAKLSREIIEEVVWEVVPELAEAIIRQEVDRLASPKK